ncbi:glycoside hydrolase family 43 protein [Hymenobacter cellulosilyticus]|uniref:Glycoside hydrolase family 43 protein n=1 Tax=Hymenobacter cellulosilyticus TaxID=2932248 RepID=A0A8T9Q257_9BACT|nr:glycoside hydrolase family 43 protein [Hymenobacter cellulosilyticus]UOQ71816.1 glycoside hydrolase family 43 protein [Hymenobacter cellulosilyticus]
MPARPHLAAAPRALLASLALLGACQSNPAQTDETTATTPAATDAAAKPDSTGKKYLAQPLVKDIYTADPSAHFFNGRIYIYPSHDIETGMPENDNGDHFAMRDYHILSMDSVGGKVTDHGVALDIKDIPWAGRQLWAPDAAFKNGTYYLYFPVKDKQDIFRIGVATSKSPTGPFKAEPKPMEGSLSIDPAVFTDTDGQTYMYMGGIWGGQLQRWRTGKYDGSKPKEQEPAASEPSVGPRVARLGADMKQFAEPVREVKILDKEGKVLLSGDNNRRFFEGAWMHKYQDKYYLTYSTGDTHFLAYATGTSPYGPFTYQGTFMNPVQGWTTHHSIVEVKGKWYIFYHDTQLSDKTWLRNVKVTELKRGADGSLALINP